MKKKLIKVADQILELDKKASEGDFVAGTKIAEIASSLTFEEMIQIDNYIQAKQLEKNKKFWYNKNRKNKNIKVEFFNK